jgi:hypothetical protein
VGGLVEKVLTLANCEGEELGTYGDIAVGSAVDGETAICDFVGGVQIIPSGPLEPTYILDP